MNAVFHASAAGAVCVGRRRTLITLPRNAVEVLRTLVIRVIGDY